VIVLCATFGTLLQAFLLENVFDFWELYFCFLANMKLLPLFTAPREREREHNTTEPANL
jgi:hypothetical protein